MNSRMRKTIWNRDFILLLSVNTFVFISMHMLSTTIAKFSMSLSGGEALAGLVAGVFSVTSIAVRPICGSLIDRKGKKGLYLASLAVMLLSMLGYSVSVNSGMLIAFRLLHGVGWGFATTIGMTMAANTAPSGKIGEATSIYGLANVLAMALAPNLGAFLSEGFGFHAMFLGSAAVVACGVLCLLLVRDQPVPAADGPSRRITLDSSVLKEAVFPACVLFLNGMAYTSITTFLIDYGNRAGIDNPSMFFTVYSAALLAVRLCSGRIVDRKGPGYILIPGGFFFTGALLLLSGLQNRWMLYGAAILLGPGYSGCLSTLMAVSMRRTTPGRRGVASSTINVGMDLGTGIGSAAAGVIAGAAGYRNLYLCLIVPVLLAVAIYIWDDRNYRAGKGIYCK